MSAGETRALRLYRGLYTYEIQLGLYIWTPALYRFSQIHRVRAWRQTLRHVWLPRGRRSSTGSTVQYLQDLLLVLPDLTQCLCENAHWGKRILAGAPRPAECQCIPCRVFPRSGSKQLAMRSLSISWAVWGWSLHSPGSAAHDSSSAARLSKPGM